MKPAWEQPITVRARDSCWCYHGNGVVPWNWQSYPCFVSCDPSHSNCWFFLGFESWTQRGWCVNVSSPHICTLAGSFNSLWQNRWFINVLSWLNDCYISYSWRGLMFQILMVKYFLLFTFPQNMLYWIFCHFSRSWNKTSLSLNVGMAFFTYYSEWSVYFPLEYSLTKSGC